MRYIIMLSAIVYAFSGHTELKLREIPKSKGFSTKDVQFIRATPRDKPVLQKMAGYFLYDQSEYMGLHSGWDMRESGEYVCQDLKDYFSPGGQAYILRIKGKLAGFVLIKTKGYGSDPSVDYHMGDFFILRKYSGAGIGRYVATHFFRTYPGKWEVILYPQNNGAYAFWKKIVGDFTRGNYTTTIKPIPMLKNRIMRLIQFSSQGVS